jgi:serine/tyrosine/threonine adenylyltransferase
MPPTDSIEKPPTVELTAGPIAVFFNSYARLPEHFFARLAPTPVPKPRLIKFNESLASELGVDAQSLEADELAAVFAGNAEPIALAYAGHQFGHFVPQLGDGRAILLGEVLDRSGERRDVQLKGAGQNAVLATRRRPRRAGAGPARISR